MAQPPDLQGAERCRAWEEGTLASRRRNMGSGDTGGALLSIGRRRRRAPRWRPPRGGTGWRDRSPQVDGPRECASLAVMWPPPGAAAGACWSPGHLTRPVCSPRCTVARVASRGSSKASGGRAPNPGPFGPPARCPQASGALRRGGCGTQWCPSTLRCEVARCGSGRGARRGSAGTQPPSGGGGRARQGRRGGGQCRARGREGASHRTMHRRSCRVSRRVKQQGLTQQGYGLQTTAWHLGCRV